MDFRKQLSNQAIEVFAKKVDLIGLDFEKLYVEMVDKYLYSPQIVEIWNGRKFKKKITQWKRIKFNFGE